MCSASDAPHGAAATAARNTCNCNMENIPVNAKRDDGTRPVEDKRLRFWRNSTYDEPVWVSLAWIIVPLLVAGILIYAVVA